MCLLFIINAPALEKLHSVELEVASGIGSIILASLLRQRQWHCIPSLRDKGIIGNFIRNKNKLTIYWTYSFLKWSSKDNVNCTQLYLRQNFELGLTVFCKRNFLKPIIQPAAHIFFFSYHGWSKFGQLYTPIIFLV